jgi:hypothetical protein
MNVPLPNAGILSPLVFCHVGFRAEAANAGCLTDLATYPKNRLWPVLPGGHQVWTVDFLVVSFPFLDLWTI